MTRFADWPSWAARLTLALLAGLVIYGAVPRTVPAAPAAGVFDDNSLYRTLADRVMRGEDYYAAAADEHRAHNYPTTPAPVFRSPVLSWWLAILHFTALAQAALVGLAVCVVLAVRSALERAGIPPFQRLAAIVVMAPGLLVVGGQKAYLGHEVWAGLFIALSLALYRPDRWLPSVALAVVACLFRELALPYMLAMGAFALLERRWREAIGWTVGVALFAGLFSVHLSIAASLYRPGDLVSESWLALGGVQFALETARRSVGLHVAPAALVALVAGATLLGLAGSRNPVANRGALIVGGYMAAFMFVGRPDESYWGLLYAPILPLGVVLAPAALLELWRRAWPAIGAPFGGRDVVLDPENLERQTMPETL